MKIRTYRPVIATFNGKHNQMKSKALIILLDRKQKELGGLTLKQLTIASSVSYEYLKARLGVWHGWRYVNRRVTTNGKNKPVFSYSIAARGIKFVNERIPPDVVHRYIMELKEYHQGQAEARRQRMATIRERLNILTE